jgi:hypothetical protein
MEKCAGVLAPIGCVRGLWAPIGSEQGLWAPIGCVRGVVGSHWLCAAVGIESEENFDGLSLCIKSMSSTHGYK